MIKKIFILVLPLIFTTIFAETITQQDQKALNDLLSKVTLKIDKNSKTKRSVLLKNIKIWSGKTSTRIAIYPSNKIKFKYNLLHGKDGIDRIYIDLLGTTKKDFKLPTLNKNTFLKGIRIGNRKKGIRIVLDVGKVENYNVIVMEEPWRIVIDYYGNKIKKKINIKEIEQSAKKIKTKKTTKIKEEKTNSKNDFVVILDPGHGGKDPGTSSNGIKEKNVVLRLAKIIQKKANKIDGLKIILTRKTDKFIPLEERAAIANEHNGDFFISIHANSFKQLSSVHGIEIYHLDNRKNEYTNKLARVENKLTGKNSMLNTILVDMTMSLYIKDSLNFAKSIGKRISKTAKNYGTTLRDCRKGALFYVLVGARMPSVLIEIGFLSNTKERKLLQNQHYLEKLAEDILNGVIARLNAMKK